ncbi:methionyl-tRNA formyltransferase [Bryobacter aggregatus]|uniref:methionyl-tRNA formyltransferase n=1 Tax=Bryobacter aggregatus TaxID=360054 RepID=UPI000ADE630B|nr:methionyl-tRNA formyltransferase [Bryobacter aggregatus]
MGIKAIFLGTPQFAVPSLEAMAHAGHQILAVYTQPDRPKGRGQSLAMSPVKNSALALGLPVRQPERIRNTAIVEELKADAPDIMVIVGYGQIIPQSIIDIPRFGIVNVHGSLLPRYRGAAPIQWAIANGEHATGVTTMQINAGLDTGDMLLKAATEIDPNETAVELGARLAPMGATLLLETLTAIEQGTMIPIPQQDSEATHAPILSRLDAAIDWNWPATVIHNRTRGFFPWPGTATQFRGQTLRISKTRVSEDSTTHEPGRVLGAKGPLRVACGQSTVLELLEVQQEGRSRVSGTDLRNGLRIAENELLGD